MILGLTGGICTGKTEAALVLARLGIRIVDADEISRFLTSYEPGVLQAIRVHFGTAVFHPMGGLNRAALAAVIFSDPGERQALEAILHPPILAIQRENMEYARTVGFPLVVAAPLLFEAEVAGEMDRVWVISASEEKQLERLRDRTGISEEEARKRISAQMSLKLKEQRANRVIYNNGSLDELAREITRAWEAFVAENR